MPAKKKASKKTKAPVAKKKRKVAKRTVSAGSAAPKRAKKKPARASASAARRKPAAKPAAKAKRATKPTAKPPRTDEAPISRRRDATGHLDPRYAAELRERGREMRDDDNDQAFLTRSRSADDLAEELGEEAVAEMTTGEDQREALLDLEA